MNLFLKCFKIVGTMKLRLYFSVYAASIIVTVILVLYYSKASIHLSFLFILFFVFYKYFLDFVKVISIRVAKVRKSVPGLAIPIFILKFSPDFIVSFYMRKSCFSLYEIWNSFANALLINVTFETTM